MQLAIIDLLFFIERSPICSLVLVSFFTVDPISNKLLFFRQLKVSLKCLLIDTAFCFQSDIKIFLWLLQHKLNPVYLLIYTLILIVVVVHTLYACTGSQSATLPSSCVSVATHRLRSYKNHQ